FALSTPAMAVAALVIVALGGSIVWIQQRGTKQAPPVAVNSPRQVKEGNSTATDNAAPPIAQTSAPEVTTATVDPTLRPEAPINLQGRKPQFKDPGATRPVTSSRDFNVSPVASIKQGQNPDGVYVGAPVKPMVLSLQDDNGATRRISLRPVSFGSHRLLVGRRVVAVSATSE